MRKPSSAVPEATDTFFDFEALEILKGRSSRAGHTACGCTHAQTLHHDAGDGPCSYPDCDCLEFHDGVRVQCLV